jgi:hypothetical protein
LMQLDDAEVTKKIFGGDFWQILPVVPKGRREDIVSACCLDRIFGSML